MSAKTIRTRLLVYLLLGGAWPVLAADLNDLSYDSSGATVIITDCDVNASGSLVIPGTLDGKAVTCIGDSAFQACSNLTQVTLPNTLTNIGIWAFGSCSGLGEITIPNSVTRVETIAFADCLNLASVTLGNGLTDIASMTFFQCRSLDNLTIPDAITYIGAAAFAECSSLSRISIPPGVDYIGLEAFRGCTRLGHVALEGPLPFFGSGVFLGANDSFITYAGSFSSVAGRPAFDSGHVPVPVLSQVPGGAIRVSFTAAAGQRYRVYKLASLDAPFGSWTQVGSEILGAGVPVTVDYTPGASESSFFFRTRVELD